MCYFNRKLDGDQTAREQWNGLFGDYSRGGKGGRNGASHSGMDKESKTQRNQNKWRTPVSKLKVVASSEQDDETVLIRMLYLVRWKKPGCPNKTFSFFVCACIHNTHSSRQASNTATKSTVVC